MRDRLHTRMRGRTEQGSALVEFVWLGVLLVVPVVWILLSVFEVQRGAFAVTAAARAAARAYTLAPDQTSAVARAEEVARFTLADQGSPEMPVQVVVVCGDGADACLSPSSSITVTVESGVRLPFLPDFFSSSESDFHLSASHTVPVGQYVERR